MINILDFPAELFYESSGENGYEGYMKNDPTGINHVLDTMYGAVFNLEEADFVESDPAFYMDAAYRMAIAIKLQKYPHRFLRMEDLANFFEEFSDAEFCLSAWMAYALLDLRDDKSEDLEKFLRHFWAYLCEEQPYSRTGEIIYKLQAIVLEEKKSGKIYNAMLYPQSPGAEIIKGLRFWDGLEVKDGDAEFLFTHVVKYDAQSQQALLDNLMNAGIFKGNYEKLSHRIDKGDFIINDEMFHTELPEASEEEQYVMRMECINEMNLWKEKAEYYKAMCDSYEQKEKLTAVIDGAVQLGKGIDTHLKDMYEDLKKGAEKQKEKLNDKIKELENELQKVKAEKAQLEQSLANKQNHANGVQAEGNIIPELFNELLNRLIDPRCISENQYPGAKKLLEIAIDIKPVNEVLDSQAENELSKNLRKVDSLRLENIENYQNRLAIKQMSLASLQTAQNVTIINGNKVERSYGDNYNLEAGAKVEALSSQPELDAQHKPQWILNNVSSQQTR